MAPTLLSALEPLIKLNRGARFEGDVFSVLLADPQVVRSFEFGAVDGALDCAPLDDTSASYSERLWRLNNAARRDPGSQCLIPFDVKNTTASVAGEQICIGPRTQQATAAFHILTYAVDPRFVDVIPNIRGDDRSDGDVAGSVSVNRSKKLHVEGSTYGFLDPYNAPYRVPLALLHESLRRIRRCFLDNEDYVNPWTLVSFAGWRPMVIRSMDCLLPSESTEHFSAYLGVMDMLRCVRNAALTRDPPLHIALDFVGVQPRLADFKFIVGQTRQVFVQYKLDVKDRRAGNYGNVAIARGEGQARRHYFSSIDRFDFLLYEFRFSNRPNPTPIVQFFFLPERILPQRFYTLQEETNEVDFDTPEFRRYLVSKDREGRWVERVLEIVDAEPRPRWPAPRPHRASDFDTPTSRHVRASLQSLHTPTPQASPPPARARWVQEKEAFHFRFFDAIMAQCASRASGLLIVMSDEHPMGDFAFCRYEWSETEREAYARSHRPPMVLHQLPAAAHLVMVYAFARSMETDSTGPWLSSAEFRRVNSCSTPRLLLFDPFGPEDHATFGSLFAVPSEDIGPSPQHIEAHKDNLEPGRSQPWRQARVPMLSDMLVSGCTLADYMASATGPLLYDGGDGWGHAWELLDRFAGTKPFTYPTSLARQPAGYHVTVQQAHQRLFEEHCKEVRKGGSDL